MSVTILVLVLLSGCMLITAKNNCKGLNGNFSTSSHIFTNCVLEHNEEATFCLDCIIDYKIFRAKYNDLVTGNDTTGSCRSRFIDNNQLDIVESVYANTKRLWDSGFCSGEFIVSRHLSTVLPLFIYNKSRKFSSKSREFFQRNVLIIVLQFVSPSRLFCD